MKINRMIALVVLCLVFVLHVQAQAPVSPPDDSPYRKNAVEPFRIIDNIYFVGTTEHNVTYLITG